MSREEAVKMGLVKMMDEVSSVFGSSGLLKTIVTYCNSRFYKRV